MARKPLLRIKSQELEESIPFIILGISTDGFPIIQMIEHPVAYKKSKRLIVTDFERNDFTENIGKKFLRIEKTITICEVIISNTNMEIILPDVKRRKLNI